MRGRFFGAVCDYAGKADLINGYWKTGGNHAFFIDIKLRFYLKKKRCHHLVGNVL